MGMGVNEPRRNRIPCKIDDLCAMTNIAADARIVAHIKDTPVLHCYGLDDGIQRIYGDDSAVDKDEIGRWFRR